MYLIGYRFITAPISDRDLYCSFSQKYNKITCVQTGDIVPKWLKIDTGAANKIFGGSSYTMQLILSKDNEKYKVLDMTESIFIADFKRKFIYEKKEQTAWDYFNLKKYILVADRSNWGSTILYCSETNLQDEACRNMKKYNK